MRPRVKENSYYDENDKEEENNNVKRRKYKTNISYSCEVWQLTDKELRNINIDIRRMPEAETQNGKRKEQI